MVVGLCVSSIFKFFLSDMLSFFFFDHAAWLSWSYLTKDWTLALCSESVLNCQGILALSHYYLNMFVSLHLSSTSQFSHIWFSWLITSCVFLSPSGFWATISPGFSPVSLITHSVSSVDSFPLSESYTFPGSQVRFPSIYCHWMISFRQYKFNYHPNLTGSKIYKPSPVLSHMFRDVSPTVGCILKTQCP